MQILGSGTSYSFIISFSWSSSHRASQCWRPSTFTTRIKFQERPQIGRLNNFGFNTNKWSPIYSLTVQLISAAHKAAPLTYPSSPPDRQCSRIKRIVQYPSLRSAAASIPLIGRARTLISAARHLEGVDCRRRGEIIPSSSAGSLHCIALYCNAYDGGNG